MSSERAGEAPVELISEVRENPFPFEWYRLTGEEHFWFQWRAAAARHVIRAAGIPPDQPLVGLEIGGGTGVLRRQLESATRWAIDMTDLQLDALRAATPGRGRTFYYDVTERRADLMGRYDVVILFDVLEHIGDTRPFLEAVLAHLRPGGALLLNVPALSSLFSSYDTAAGHCRRYERGSLRAELAPFPFRVDAVRYWGASLVPLLALRKLLLALRPRDEAATIRTGFQPPGATSHAALRALMRAELALLRSPPLGTSLLLAGHLTAAPPVPHGKRG